MQRNLVLPHRQHAARMQDLRAVARDFLGLVVVQGAQQPRGRDGARVGAEHARNVGPNLEARRARAWPRNTSPRCPSRRARAAPCRPRRSTAMKPCVITTRSSARHCVLQALHRARNRRWPTASSPSALAPWRALGAQHRARIRPRRSRCPGRSRTPRPSAVASSSPIAMTLRARAVVRRSRVLPALRGHALASSARKRSNTLARHDPRALRQIAVHGLDALERRAVRTRQRRPRAGIRVDR